MIIKNGLVFTGENLFSPLSIQTNNNIITGLIPEESTPQDDETVMDASGCYVIPGLTDIHFHGCDGYDFCDNSMEACIIPPDASLVKRWLSLSEGLVKLISLA